MDSSATITLSRAALCLPASDHSKSNQHNSEAKFLTIRAREGSDYAFRERSTLSVAITLLESDYAFRALQLLSSKYIVGLE